MKRGFLVLVALSASYALLRAQAPAGSSPTFDVAAIKPNASGEQQFASYVEPGGRYTAINVSTRYLIKIAYGLHDDQVVGAPGWIDTDRFDIRAKAEGFASAPGFRDTSRLMLRPLLVDRFKLALRRERRELPVHALVLAKTERELGPQIHRTVQSECNGPAPPIPPAAGAAEPAVPLACGAEMFRPGHLAARGMPFSILVLNLSRWTDHLVVDRTGLTGTFDWEIQWVPDEVALDAKPSREGPSMFTALRDQAGLKVESSKGTVDVFVVEHAERPESD